MQVLFKSLLISVLFLFASVTSPTYAQTPAASSNFVSLNVTDFKKELANQKGLVLDVRTPAEFAKGHLPNAVNLNYQDPGFKQAIKNLNPNQTYFIYCAVGGRSAKACTQLKSNGLNKVYNLAGGIVAWQQAGEVIVK